MYIRYRFAKRLIGTLSVLASTAILFTNCESGFKTMEDPFSRSSAQWSSLNNCGTEVNSVSRAPQTIDEAVQLINELPKPLSISCFLASLKRPLKVFAVDNVFSAQPAAGRENPRIFIFSDNLVISVVPKGIGKDLVEFSEVLNSQASVKGELAFPVANELPPEAPYKKIQEASGGTSCKICHGGEVRFSSITTGEAFASNIIFPESFQRVPQSALHFYSLNCDDQADQFRCQMLRTIFMDGAAQDAEFPKGSGRQ